MRRIALVLLLLSPACFGATITSTATGDFSAGATWVGGVAPGDGDGFIIATGHTVTFDVDQSAYVTGMVAGTIQDGAELTAETGAGSYWLAMAADLDNLGTLSAGSSGTAYPSNCTFVIDFSLGAAGTRIDCATSDGVVNFYCTQPTNTYIKLSAQEAAAQTILSVDTDVTGDIWADGDQIVICDIDGTGSSDAPELRTIAGGGIAANTITVTAGITRQKESGAYMFLLTRNIRVIGCTSYAFKDADDSYIRCESYNGAGLTGGYNSEFAGIHANTTATSGYGWQSGYACTCSGIITYCHSSSLYGRNLTLSGIFAPTYTGFNQAQGSNMTGDAIILGGDKGFDISYSGAVYGTFDGNKWGLNECGGFILSATFNNNVADFRRVINSFAYDTLFGGATEFLDYDIDAIGNSHYTQSLNHDNTENAFKAWCRGGIVTSQTASPPTGYSIWYELACEDTTQTHPVYRQYQTTILPGTALEVDGKIRIADGEDLTGVEPRLQIIDYYADPLVDSSNSALDEDLIPEPDGGVESSWQDVSVIYANQNDYAMTVWVRMIAWCDTGAATEVDVVWSIADYQDQIASIYNKLPTNYIMGSSVQTDKDDEIDAIKAKTDNLPSDPADQSLIETAITTAHATTDAAIAALNNLSASDVNTAVWTAQMSDFSGEATFGGEVQTLDPNITAILADTNELQTDWTNGGRLDVILDAIKAITDLLPLVTTDVNDANDANNFTVTAGKAADDAFTGCWVMVEDADDSNRELRLIEQWTDSLEIDVDFPFTFTPTAGDSVWIWTGYLGDLLERMARVNQTTNVYDYRTGATSSTGQGMTIYNQAGDDP